jgi:hypothetical protein
MKRFIIPVDTPIKPKPTQGIEIKKESVICNDSKLTKGLLYSKVNCEPQARITNKPPHSSITSKIGSFNNGNNPR